MSETAEEKSAVLDDQIRQQVRESYAQVADRSTQSIIEQESGDGDAPEEEGSTCCAPVEETSGCCDPTDRPARRDPNASSIRMGYSEEDVAGVPEGANMGLGCGNPQAIANLKPGEVVVDLGSGGGFDCFLASRQVGDAGQVIGIDMTPQMISKARENSQKAGSTNVEFRLGEIENLPVADGTVDVIMSNCVINLSPDKPRVLAESFRILKPGGRLAISDIVGTKALPESLQEDMGAYCGCISGAAPQEDLVEMMKDAGFEEVSVEAKPESREFIQNWIPNSGIENHIISAKITAKKPVK